MRRLNLLITLLSVSLLVFGCGQMGGYGNCPSGVTGGDDDGYGYNDYENDGGYGLDPALWGGWRYDESGSSCQIVVFENNGTFMEEFHPNGAFPPNIPGIYHVVGNELNLHYGNFVAHGAYSIDGNTLTFNVNGLTKEFHRINRID